MGRKIARFILNLIVILAARVQVIGEEKIPSQGSYIAASNHIGRLDAILVFHFSKRDDIIMIVAEKYRKIPLARWFVKQLDLIWVDRFNADFGALREVLHRLKKGGVLVLAPEGTRSPTASLQKARPGGSFLAMKAGVPIFPVALAGSEDEVVYASLKRLKRPLITVRVGDPFTLPPVKGKDREAVMEEYTDELMCRIAAQLPPRYRGVYADHPRLQELLAAQAG